MKAKGRPRRRWFRMGSGLATTTIAALLAAPAIAGPPYVTDDPQPTDHGHWEIYAFTSFTRVSGLTAGASGLDINYGAFKDVQATVVIPVAWDSTGASGIGEVEIALKYKVLHQKAGSWTPDVAIFPRLFTPAVSARFRQGGPSLWLPVWAQKDFGPWSVFGGGGYTFHPGAGNRGFWTEGLTVTRDFGERLNLGVEIYHQDAARRDEKTYTGLNLGVIYKATKHWSLLAAAGPGVQNARDQGQFNAYLALQAVY